MAQPEVDRDPARGVNRSPATGRAKEPLIATAVGILGALASGLAVLYQLASEGVRFIPLGAAIMAAAFIVLSIRNIMRRRPRMAIAAPMVIALVFLGSSAFLAGPEQRTTGTASVIRMDRLATKAAGPRYRVGVKVIDQPADGQNLWLISILYSEPGKVKDTLYFVKSPVSPAPGTYQLEIQYCKPLAADLQRGLQVVSADDEVSKVLARNRLEEDNCIENTDMTNLGGAVPVSPALKFMGSP